MGKVYVQAKSIIYANNEHGERVTYHPPSWVPVSKARARELIANGQAIIPRQDRYKETMQFDGCGVLVRSGIVNTAALGRAGEILPVEYGGAELLFDYTMLWEANKITACEQVVIAGFSKLLDFEGTGEERWEILAMLIDENKIADDYGSQTERDKTLEVVGDLRLPVYDTSLMFWRKTANTERVMEYWRDEIDAGADDRHAFLRALYTQRAMVCTLPPGWNLRLA